MADVLKKMVVPQKAAQKRPRQYKHDSVNQIFANPSKEEVTDPSIPLNSERDCRSLQCTC
jgi:hypothetical protein